MIALVRGGHCDEREQNRKKLSSRLLCFLQYILYLPICVFLFANGFNYPMCMHTIAITEQYQDKLQTERTLWINHVFLQYCDFKISDFLQKSNKM